MNSYQEQLTGVITALVTPFDTESQVDFEAFDTLLDQQLAAGVTGLLPVGTTGEAATLTEEERSNIIGRTVKAAAGKAFVLAGTGSNDTAKAVAWTRKAEDLGVDGCLVVTPYYNKPTQQGLIDYYSRVADCTTVPIILYSVPGRCGVEIAPETAAQLRERHHNIIGIKEAGGSVERVTELSEACGGDFIIHCGDDALTLPFLATGAIGVTSVVSNVAPELMVELIQAWQQRDLNRALQLHRRVHQLAAALFIEGNPVPVKAALAMQGCSGNTVRSPLAPLAPNNAQYVADTLSAYQAYKSATCAEIQPTHYTVGQLS